MIKAQRNHSDNQHIARQGMKKKVMVVWALCLPITGLITGCINSTAKKPSVAPAQPSSSGVIEILPHELEINSQIEWAQSGGDINQENRVHYRIADIYSSALGKKCIRAEPLSNQDPILFCHLRDSLYQAMPALSKQHEY